MSADTVSKTTQKSVLGSRSHAFMSAAVYGMLFVALMVATGGPITIDSLLLPIVGIYAVIGTIEYVIVKKQKFVPRWFVIGSFGVGITTAIVMAIIFL